MKTYYDVLGISPDAGPDEIKRAYHQLALHYHPDKNGTPEAAERMRQINEAYQTLSDPPARARYDATLAPAAPVQSSAGQASGSSPPAGDYGFEMPRTTKVYEHTASFSIENLLASALMGVSFGMMIAAAFIFLGIRLETRQGIATAILLAAIAFILPPLIAVIHLRGSISTDSEAGTVGSITLSATLLFAIAATTIIPLLFWNPDQSASPLCPCCGLAPLSAIVGWVVGGWMGKITRVALPI